MHTFIRQTQGETRPTKNGADRGSWSIQPTKYGYVVLDPLGKPATGLIKTRADAENRRDRLQAETSSRAGKRKRPCMCCGRPFASAGIHNRLCVACKQRGDATWEGSN